MCVRQGLIKQNTGVGELVLNKLWCCVGGEQNVWFVNRVGN